MKTQKLITVLLIITFFNTNSFGAETYKDFHKNDNARAISSNVKENIEISTDKHFSYKKSIFHLFNRTKPEDGEPEREKAGFIGFIMSLSTLGFAAILYTLIFVFITDSAAAPVLFAVTSFTALAAGITSMVLGITGIIKHIRHKNKYKKLAQPITASVLGFIETLFFLYLSYVALFIFTFSGF